MSSKPFANNDDARQFVYNTLKILNSWNAQQHNAPGPSYQPPKDPVPAAKLLLLVRALCEPDKLTDFTLDELSALEALSDELGGMVTTELHQRARQGITIGEDE